MITMDAVRVAWILSLFIRVFGLEQEAISSTTWSSSRQGRPASLTDLNNRRAFKFIPGERRISSEISFQNVAHDPFEGVHPRRRVHNYTKLSMVPTEKIITSSVFLDHSPTQIPSHLANVFTPNPLAVSNNDYDDDQQLIYVSSKPSTPSQDNVATPHPYVSTSVVKYHPSTISPPPSSTLKPPVKNLVKETRKEDSEEEDEDEDEEDDDDDDDDDDDEDDDDDDDEEEEDESEETHDTSIKDSEEDLATDETKDDDSGYDDGSYSPKKKKGKKKKKKKGGKKKKKKGQFKMKHLKKLKKYMFPLLLAYKLKFFTLIPLMLGGLVLIVGTTGFAGFFFALFAIGLSLQKH